MLDLTTVPPVCTSQIGILFNYLYFPFIIHSQYQSHLSLFSFPFHYYLVFLFISIGCQFSLNAKGVAKESLKVVAMQNGKPVCHNNKFHFKSI